MNPMSLLRLFLLAALWGGSFLFMRVSVPVLGAIPTAFGRVALGAMGLYGLIAFWRTGFSFKGKFTATLVLGVINSGIPFLLFAFAAKVLPAGYSAIINATTPLMGVLIGAFAFGEQITMSKAVGVVTGFAGVAILTRTGPTTVNGPMLWGIAACLGATACYGLAGFLTKRWITLRGGLGSSNVAFGSQIGAMLMLSPFMVWDEAIHPLTWHDVHANVWISMLALGLLCTSFGYVLYFRLIADVGPMKALTVTFLIPFFGTLWGWLLLNEVATLAHVFGGGLIAIALWLILQQGSSQVQKINSNKQIEKA
ncbi:DMT family transporter [Undibacterium sp. Ji67W]|uniref:DMT family transporter n=1 Tax=Undibacterium sp. Ji67W TaxID=3413042 RepID=UPI003BF3E96C